MEVGLGGNVGVGIIVGVGTRVGGTGGVIFIVTHFVLSMYIEPDVPELE